MSITPAASERAYSAGESTHVAGVGIDIVDMDRLADRLIRHPRLKERLFTPDERELSLASLGARVAAKEAVGKALGNPGDLSWHDVTVRKSVTGSPVVVLTGESLATAESKGITHIHLSLSHDGRIATAMVVAERSPAKP